MELIDQLGGGGLALSVVEEIFGNRIWARRAIEHYLQKQVVCLARHRDEIEAPLSKRECYEALWSDASWEQPAACYAHLTEFGVKRWESGHWDDIWKDKHS